MRPRNTAPSRSGNVRPDRFRFPREVIAELRRVTWPSREETVRLTVMVLVVSAAIGLFLGVLDYLFSVLVDLVLVQR